jgi:integrase
MRTARRKRPHNTGSITTRRDPKTGRILRYEVRITLPDGTRKHVGVAGSKAEARALLQRALDEREQLIARPAPTLREACERLLRDLERRCRPTTLLSYQVALRRVERLRPDLWERDITDLRPADLDDLSQQLAASYCGGASRISFDLVRRALEVALRREEIRRNPAALVDPPRVRTTVRSALSAQEQKRLLASACAEGGRWGALVLLLATSGLRISEALALRWEDVDLVHGQLFVRQTWSDAPGGRVLAPPKTTAGVRVVPLPEMATSALHDWRSQQQLLFGQQEFCFAAARGSPPARNYVSKVVRALAERVGITDVTPHVLRHTLATRLAEHNTPVAAATAILGQADRAVYLNRYVHESASTEAVRAVLNAYFGDGSETNTSPIRPDG